MSLRRQEALGAAGEGPYLAAEGGEAATSQISLVRPGDASPGHIESGYGGTLTMILEIAGGMIELGD